MSSTWFTEHARTASNIVYTARNTSSRRRHVRLDRIGHEREVAGLLAVTVYSYRLTTHCGAQEFVETHVRTLPRSVDREIA